MNFKTEQRLKGKKEERDWREVTEVKFQVSSQIIQRLSCNTNTVSAHRNENVLVAISGTNISLLFV